MKLNIDKFGRILIPKPIRDRLGLSAGMELEIDVENQGIHLSPSHPEPELKEQDQLLVFTGRVEDDLSGAVKKHRDQRLDSLKQS